MNNTNKGRSRRGRVYIAAAFTAIALVLAGYTSAAAARGGLKAPVAKEQAPTSQGTGGVWMVSIKN